MAGPAVNVAYAAAGDITATAGTAATALEGTKFYLGTSGVLLYPVAAVTGSDFVTIGAAAPAGASTAVFEVRNLKTVDETSVSFELWTAGKQLGVKNDGTAFDDNDKAEDIFTSFVATYADKKDAGTLNIEISSGLLQSLVGNSLPQLQNKMLLSCRITIAKALLLVSKVKM